MNGEIAVMAEHLRDCKCISFFTFCFRCVRIESTIDSYANIEHSRFVCVGHKCLWLAVSFTRRRLTPAIDRVGIYHFGSYIHRHTHVCILCSRRPLVYVYMIVRSDASYVQYHIIICVYMLYYNCVCGLLYIQYVFG